MARDDSEVMVWGCPVDLPALVMMVGVERWQGNT